MSFIFEVYCPRPLDPQREAALTQSVLRLGGKLTYRDTPLEREPATVCLTYEFENLDLAETAADKLRQQGAHVEGPTDYGP
jgi:hypothetical protein